MKTLFSYTVLIVFIVCLIQAIGSGSNRACRENLYHSELTMEQIKIACMN